MESYPQKAFGLHYKRPHKTLIQFNWYSQGKAECFSLPKTRGKEEENSGMTGGMSSKPAPSSTLNVPIPTVGRPGSWSRLHCLRTVRLWASHLTIGASVSSQEQ